MATKIYGSCTGSTATRYDLWAEITQNSQNIAANKSNVTVALKVKRNDGYAASAYNLYQGDNSVTLTVGGTVRINKTLTIDTRGLQTATLASWTGDVSHASDGTLSLSIAGSFSMDTTGLSGGSVSGSFNCSRIPRASTLTLSVSSVNPGGDVTATVTPAVNTFNHKIVWKIGSYSATSTLAAGVASKLFTVSATWANAVTKAKSGNIAVTLYTYSGTTLIGTKAYSLTLAIPNTSAYKPEFDISLTRNNNSVPAEWGVYVKGKSSVSVNISNAMFKAGAAVLKVSATVDSTTASSLPATFELTKSGSVTISVKLTDSRGYYTTKTQTITVEDYSPPSAQFTDLYRCNPEGIRQNDGTCLAAEYTVSSSDVDSHNSPVISLSYRSSQGGTDTVVTPVEASPFVFGEGNISKTLSYRVTLSVSDSISTEPQEFKRSITTSAVAFNIRNTGNGAAFGCYCEAENELTVAWDMNVKGVLKYTELMDCLTLSPICSAVNGTMRYYQCLGAVAVRLRFTLGTAIGAGLATELGSVSNKAPSIMNQLGCTPSTTAAICNGYINYLGEIKIKSSEPLPAGTNIYFNGFWFTVDNTEV